MRPRHQPVLLHAMLEAMAPRAAAVYLDGTFGDGGYSEALLRACECHVIALDRDPTCQERADALAARYRERFHFVVGCFGDMEEALGERGHRRVDGIVLDLGASSAQLEDAARGFSYQQDGPLDMRMGKASQSAADLINQASAEELARIFRDYGEEPRARRLARAVVGARAQTPFTRTKQLADFLAARLGAARQRHPAMRCFQALRIAVNDELGELERALEVAPRLLRARGCLAVVSFHSLEDRMVKQRFTQLAGLAGAGSRHQPPSIKTSVPQYRLWNKRARRARADELAQNRRAQSARLRALYRCAEEELAA